MDVMMNPMLTFAALAIAVVSGQLLYEAQPPKLATRPRSLRILLLAPLSLMFAPPAHACPKQLPKYVSCQPLVESARTLGLTREKVEVVYFFNYFCKTCRLAKNEVSSWSKQLPPNVGFSWFHVHWRNSAISKEVPFSSTSVFLALKSLGVTDHEPVLRAFEAGNYSDPLLLTSVAQSAGRTRESLDKALTSPSMQEWLDEAAALTKRLRIDSVPAFVVNGKYIVSVHGDSARDVADALGVVVDIAR
jgi:thiol:disulfide interchange protein DsbA